MRILNCEDHPIFRDAIRRAIEQNFTGAEIIDADTSAKALELIKENDFDLILMDIKIPGISGLQLLPHIFLHKPSAKVLMFSENTDLQFARMAYNAGAMGYLNKHAGKADLVFAIGKVMQGKKYFSTEVMETLNKKTRYDKRKTKHDVLSDLEFMIMIELATGKSQVSIASEMDMNSKTISVHKKHIMDKMGFQNLIELRNYCVEYKFIVDCTTQSDWLEVEKPE
jgi:DNA-binding NarL/FixJ family response regulator